MKKKSLLALLLAVVMCIGLCACGGGASPEELAGTYKNITFMDGVEYTLNENSTYDSYRAWDKGTFEPTSDGGFVLTNSEETNTITVAKKDNYYYVANSDVQSFKKDEDYGQPPTFNENGVSNQWFCAYYDSISDTAWHVIILELMEDGTFKLRDCDRDSNGGQTEGTLYKGTYSLDDYVLNLTCEDGQVIPFLFIDDVIYFNVMEKQ